MFRILLTFIWVCCSVLFVCGASLAEPVVQCKDRSRGISFRLNQPMQFCMSTDIYMSAVGEITRATPEKLVKYLIALKRAGWKPHSITFHSPGGSLFAGMELGFVIRRLKLDTHVGQNSNCASAWHAGFHRRLVTESDPQRQDWKSSIRAFRGNRSRDRDRAGYDKLALRIPYQDAGESACCYQGAFSEKRPDILVFEARKK